DGECHAELGLPGVCTLRAAIQEANANPGLDQIWLGAGQVHTLTRVGQDASASNGDLDIDGDVQLLFLASGQRPVVDAGGLERAFEVHGGNVLMVGFDITGGDARLAGDQSGGAIAVNFGAGLVQLSLLRVYGNRANFGAGLYNDGAQTTVTACEFSDNQAYDDFTDSAGSAILNRGTLLVEQSGVYGNSGVGGLGAIAIENVPPFSGEPALNLVNSTVALNAGFGVASREAAALVVRNSTIVANSNVGVRNAGAGGSFHMRNSVVARNGNDDCVISVAASLNLDRYNMDSDDSCELSDGTSNYPGVEPYLTPPAYRGGFARSVWPLTRSPVIDQGHPVIGAIGCEEEDQEFNERPVDFDGNGNARCDVGAIELDDDVIFHDPWERL
ncbi:MAG TPA: right-handed parallel beta-helix repeat-containing protein, partial [Dokdonella sp.]